MRRLGCRTICTRRCGRWWRRRRGGSSVCPRRTASVGFLGCVGQRRGRLATRRGAIDADSAHHPGVSRAGETGARGIVVLLFVRGARGAGVSRFRALRVGDGADCGAAPGSRAQGRRHRLRVSQSFAAVWGFVDRDDVLWLTGEHYASQQPLSFHAKHLPKDAMWYADPSGANDIEELRYAGFLVR